MHTWDFRGTKFLLKRLNQLLGFGAVIGEGHQFVVGLYGLKEVQT
jgi:hypothetical protein